MFRIRTTWPSESTQDSKPNSQIILIVALRNQHGREDEDDVEYETWH